MQDNSIFDLHSKSFSVPYSLIFLWSGSVHTVHVYEFFSISTVRYTHILHESTIRTVLDSLYSNLGGGLPHPVLRTKLHKRHLLELSVTRHFHAARQVVESSSALRAWQVLALRAGDVMD